MKMRALAAQKRAACAENGQVLYRLRQPYTRPASVNGMNLKAF